jgi:hypothetical protein
LRNTIRKPKQERLEQGIVIMSLRPRRLDDSKQMPKVLPGRLAQGLIERFQHIVSFDAFARAQQSSGHACGPACAAFHQGGSPVQYEAPIVLDNPKPLVDVSRTVSFSKPGIYELTLRATAQHDGVSDY